MSDSESAGNWCLIESDPGVFSELIREFGVTGVQVEELWGIDADQFEDLVPVHGLVFLFQWVKDESPAGSVVQDNRLDKIFFAKQVIENACASQAILSILLNCRHPDLKLGPTLTELKDFCQGFDANMKGLTISNSPVIKSVHNSFARQQLFEYESTGKVESEEVYHFVSYVPIDGRLYELDGLRPGPIDLGPIPTDTLWTDIVIPILDKRIRKYHDGNIHFSLMSIISDRIMLCERQIEMMKKQGEDGTMTPEAAKIEILRLKTIIEEEQTKRKAYQIENIRRKHNYIPLIIELLKILAKDGKLLPIYEEAKKNTMKRHKKK